MRTIYAGVALLIALTGLHAETISVYIEDHAGVPGSLLYLAKDKAEKIFQAANVDVVWHNGNLESTSPEEQPPILVQILRDALASEHRRALAFAHAFGNGGITVLFERVRASMPEAPSMSLAYVLVHEITHILEGLDRHSETGIMKGNWNWDDHSAMRRGRLALSVEDVHLIHVGLAARLARSLTPPCPTASSWSTAHR